MAPTLAELPSGALRPQHSHGLPPCHEGAGKGSGSSISPRSGLCSAHYFAEARGAGGGIRAHRNHRRKAPAWSLVWPPLCSPCLQQPSRLRWPCPPSCSLGRTAKGPGRPCFRIPAGRGPRVLPHQPGDGPPVLHPEPLDQNLGSGKLGSPKADKAELAKGWRWMKKEPRVEPGAPMASTAPTPRLQPETGLGLS